MENITKLHDDLFVFLEQRREYNNDLKYTLRKDNFGNTLRNGFWFLGDNQTLILSFWKWENLFTKKPSVSVNFEMDKELIYLEITVEKSQSELLPAVNLKVRFLQDILIREIGNSLEEYEERDLYIYKYRLGPLFNWKEILHEFLQREKVEIDTLISNYYREMSVITNSYEGDFGIIRDIEFRRNLRKVRKYRETIEELKEFEYSSYDNRKKPYYLLGFDVEDFGPIKKIRIDNVPKDNKWIFITGANGSGKSLLLKSIALTIGQGMIPNNYVKYLKIPKFKVQLYGSLGEVSIYRVGNDKESKNAKRSILRGFAAYGIHRTTIRTNINISPRESELTKNGFLESILGERITPLIDFRKTIEEWTGLDSSREKFNHRKDFFVKALLRTVPGLVDIHFVNIGRRYVTEFFLRYEDEEVFKVEYDQLSSGTKSILTFVADIIVRFYKQQPEAYDPSEFMGVVIVDEIDLHLHPQGQKDLIGALNEVFPNIQFIVSTHSPIPLLEAPKNTVVYRVDRNSENGINVKRIDTLVHLEDLLPNTILTSPIFGMDSIVNSNRDSSSRVITQDDYREIELSQKLRSRIYDFLTDRKQEELIKLFEDRRK